jgi:hypothetical protein
VILVGLTGYAQHGKDTVGARLVDKWGFQRFAFADALKSMALVLNPVVLDYADGEGPMPRLAKLVEDIGWEGAKQYPEVRRFLQVLGTEAVRGHLGEQAWVDALHLTLMHEAPERAVITDVRFPNEAIYVNDMGGKMARVERLNADGSLFDNGLGTEHPSEKYIMSLPANYIMVSPEGVELVERKADNLAAFVLGTARLTASEAGLA